MTPYIILLIVVGSIVYIGQRSNDPLWQWGCTLAFAIVLILFAGLRNFSVGSDTGVYINWFYASIDPEFIWQTNEIGYNLLSVFARSLSEQYYSLLILVALLTVSLYVATVLRLTPSPELSIYLFITLGTYTFFFNGARQGIAAAICFAALPYVLSRRPLAYAAAVGLAALFHQTALIAAVIYFIASPTITWRRVLMVAITGIGALVLLQSVVDLASALADDKFSTYADAGEGGGEVMALFLLAQGACLYLLRPPQTSSAYGAYCRLLNIYVLGLIPAVISVVASVNPSGILRLHLYFTHCSILLWPMAAIHFVSVERRGVLISAVVIVAFVHFVLTTTAFSNLTPYRLNSEILP